MSGAVCRGWLCAILLCLGWVNVGVAEEPEPELAKLKPRATVKFTPDVQQPKLALTPDGRTLAAGLALADVGVFDVAQAKQSNTLKVDPVITSVSISADGRVVASGSPNNTMTVYTLTPVRRQVVTNDNQRTVSSVSVRPDGQTIAFADARDHVGIWDVKTAKVIFSGSPGKGGGSQVFFSPDGSTLLAWGQAPTCYLLEPDGKTRAELVGHKPGPRGSAILCANFSEDSKLLATGGADATVRIWDAKSGKLLQTLDVEKVRSFNWATFTPDAKLIATSMGDNSVGLWDAQTGQLKQRLAGHIGEIRRIDISPDAKWLVSASSDKTMRLWRMSDRKPVALLEGHGEMVGEQFKGDMVWQVMFAGEKALVSAGADRTLQFWDLSKLK
jgi:WD40 repeat protein